jgi:hypothetical protein
MPSTAGMDQFLVAGIIFMSLVAILLAIVATFNATALRSSRRIVGRMSTVLQLIAWALSLRITVDMMIGLYTAVGSGDSYGLMFLFGLLVIFGILRAGLLLREAKEMIDQYQ